MHVDDESAGESEEESPRPTKRESSPVVENDDTDEAKVQLRDHNWSFLSTILPGEENIEH